jgi:hypothetical protein
MHVSPWITVVVATTVIVAARSEAQEPGRVIPAFDPTRGRDLALKYCTACHLFPEPATLTKTAWSHHVQPEMAKWLGLERVDYEGLPDGKLLADAGLFPSSAIISEEEWFSIWDYYRAVAPSRPLPQPAKPKTQVGLKGFRIKKVNPHQGVPMTSLVKIDSRQKQLYVADAFANVLLVLNPAGEATSRVRLGGGAVSLAIRDSGLHVTLIGRVFPSDALEGTVLLLPRDLAEGQPRTLLERLRRPTDTIVANLNTDGREDLVVCSFGNRLGRFSWFEGMEGGGFEEHILLDRPGAIRSEVRDFNGDGRPDIMVMMAQAREGIYLFLNQGRNLFKMETVVEAPPSWGFAGFEVVDFNKDGRLDLVAANGDNGDLALPLKNYHGVRVYLNDGNGHFVEAFFYPMHGAYRAVARDFDHDGDTDLAAIAFYPDFGQESPESFVFLENEGGMKFAAFTCAESNSGRWLTMDAGDLDGDGDEEIVLGSFVRGPTTVPVPQTLRDRWRAEGAAVLLLENTGQ